jgi:carbon-monoxide dehydrogenase medium subunit
MMLPPFEIHQPATSAEAALLRSVHGDSAVLYAGGTELLLAMKEGLGSFEHLIDVKTIVGLDGLTLDAGGALAIGATVTHRQVERSPLIRERFPLLAEMARQVANARVRAVGTLGGNLCFGEPHSDPPTALLVHDAAVTLHRAADHRRLSLADFVVGPYETALGEDEILTSVDVPPLPARAFGAYLKFGMHERPTVAVAALLVVDERATHVTEARVAVGCVGPVATRLPALESQLSGVAIAALQNGFAAAGSAGTALDAVSDLHGSAAYKRHLASVLVKRALAVAATRARTAA